MHMAVFVKLLIKCRDIDSGNLLAVYDIAVPNVACVYRKGARSEILQASLLGLTLVCLRCPTDRVMQRLREREAADETCCTCRLQGVEMRVKNERNAEPGHVSI